MHLLHHKLLFVSAETVLKRYVTLACAMSSNQQMSALQQWELCLSKPTYTYKIDADITCTTAY